MRNPSDLTRAELVALVEGLREVMYGGTDDDGNDTWEPDLHVNGADLVAWVADEMVKHGLVPEAGPRV